MSQTSKKKPAPEETEGNALDVLFPKKVVDLGHGVKLEMFPIALPDLAHVMDTFLKITLCKVEGKSDAEIAIICMKEIISLLPYSTDYPLKEIPHYCFPDILEAFLDLNMTEDLVKKWTALVGRVSSVTDQGNPLS